MYQTMKQDLLESQKNELVVGEMIENLKLRLELLNHQLYILQEISKTKNKSQSAINL